MKKLRRKGIAHAPAANAFFETSICPSTTLALRSRPPRPKIFHTGRPARPRSTCALRLEETRTVSNDWVVRYANRYFQLARQSHQPPARSTVQVRENAAGAIELRYRGRLLPLAGDSGAAAQAAVPAGRAAPGAAHAPIRRRPSGDHPWSRGYEERQERGPSS